MIRTANIEVSLQRLSILRIEHPQANPLKLACTLRAGEALPSGLTITAEIHTSRNVAAETAPLASSSVTVAADATTFGIDFTSAQLNQTVTPDSTRALWLVVYGVGDADQLYTFAAADLLLGWHAISTLTADPPATSILVEKGGVAWASGREYASGTVVTVGTTAYVCTVDHESAAGDQPGVSGGEWPSFWVVLSGGGGGGATNLGATASPTNVVITSDTGTDATIPAADGTNAGLMLPAQVTKLAGVATGATANATDAQLRDRSTHTGTQAISTIVNLQTTLDGKAATTHTHSIADVTGLQTALDGKAATSHNHSSSQINDSTAAGRAILTAADVAAQRSVLGLGTLATQNGTFSGTSSGTNTGDVSLAGSPDYLSIVGQVITRTLVNLTSHITGILAIANGGTNASTPGAAVTNLTTIADNANTTINLSASDSGTVVRCTASTAVAVNLPGDLGVGFNCLVIQAGTGQITFAGTSGATVNSFGSLLKSAGRHSTASIIRVASSMYNLSGNLTA